MDQKLISDLMRMVSTCLRILPMENGILKVSLVQEDVEILIPSNSYFQELLNFLSSRTLNPAYFENFLIL